MMLFFLDGPSCFLCHGGPDFSGRPHDEFHNTALYNLHGPFAFPAPNFGLYSITKRAADMGKFKAPTLRNIALTAPYMHNGAFTTLAQVIDFYNRGGGSGVGARVPGQTLGADSLGLSAPERHDLEAFLKALTDTVAGADFD